MTEPVSAIARAAGLGTSRTNNDQVRSRAKNRGKPEPNIEDSPKEAVDRAIQELEAYIDSTKRSLDISVYKPTGDIIVKEISEADGKIIREIPSEEVLNRAAKLEQLEGLLFDDIY